MIKVYHERQPSWGWSASPWPDGYELVAQVEDRDGRDSLDWAFERTNHIDRDWWRNEGVTKMVDRPVRSTSVGDILVLSADGSMWQVAPAGWNPIPPGKQPKPCYGGKDD